MKNNPKKYLFLFLLLSICNLVFSQEKGLHSIGKEQKLYELSVIWKELSYNFGNMDNCPGLDLDSLYRSYIPIIQDTKNDYEYFKSIQHFLANFNNVHTYSSRPSYIWRHLSYPLLKTNYKDGKIIIELIGKHYSDRVSAGDEILKIDEIPALDYIKKHGTAYVSASNENTKIKGGLIDPNNHTLISYASKEDKKQLRLDVKTSGGIEKIKISYDMDLYPASKDTLKQKKRLNNISKIDFVEIKKDNILLTDSINNFAYIRLLNCDMQFHHFFVENYETILKYNNLIVDVADNGGGDGKVTSVVLQCLIDNDSVSWNYLPKTRVHNAWNKAKAAVRIFYFEDSLVTQHDKDLYYPYYYGTAFEAIDSPIFANRIPSENRYKGNIYIVVKSNTASAAESFALMAAQNPKTTLIGEKTAGAMSQPLVVRLPSGLEVCMETAKAYDSKGNDISQGITPDIEYDFSDFYNTNDPNEVLSNFVEYIKEFLKE